MKKIFGVFWVSAFFLLAACSGGGGGGGGTTQTNPEQVFSLSKYHDLTPGLVYSTQVSGSVTPGGAVTGTFSVTNRAPLMRNSIFVTPTDTVVSLTLDGVTAKATGTSYRDQEGYLVEDFFEGVTCTPVFPSRMPNTIRAGDAGTLPELVCTDSTIWTTSWRAESAGPDKINLVLASTNKSFGNATLLTGTDTYTIGISGNILKYRGTGSGQGVSMSIASP